MICASCLVTCIGGLYWVRSHAPDGLRGRAHGGGPPCGGSDDVDRAGPTPGASSGAYEVLMGGVPDLLLPALQQDALRSIDSLRRELLDTLDRLLYTMAEALDIRHLFSGASASVRGGLQHDILALTSWGEKGKSFRVYAMTGAQVDDPGFWASTILTEEERALLHRDPYVVRDVGTEIAPGSVRGRIFARLGVRSALRVPMPLGTGVVNLTAIERSLVMKALTQARHNKTRAAKLVGLAQAQLYSRIEKYGLAETEAS